MPFDKRTFALDGSVTHAMIDGTYNVKDEQYFAYARPEMLAFVPASVQRMLEVGCGSAAFAALLKRRSPVHVTAIEAHQGAAATARQRVDRVLEMPIEAALPHLVGEQFDCIVLNDVLEHLVDPWATMRSLRPLLAEQGRLVASLPNVRYLPVFKDYVLRGRWQYADDGVLDRTHLRFFTKHAMGGLFETSGYELLQLEGINPVAVSWKFKLLDAVTRGALADTQFKQFACVARAQAGP